MDLHTDGFLSGQAGGGGGGGDRTPIELLGVQFDDWHAMITPSILDAARLVIEFSLVRITQRPLRRSPSELRIR